MKKGFRIFKRKLKKIKKLIISEEYLKLIEYILFLIQKNIEILGRVLKLKISNIFNNYESIY